MKKRILSILLSFVMVLSMMPVTAVAGDTEKNKAKNKEDEYVYLSISYDGKYIDDIKGDPIVYVPIALEDIAAVDLTDYGLDNMLYDEDGDGDYETTALQLLIYAHENLYGGDWGEVNFDALPGSSYFKGGIFGFTENLMYFHNGDFPVDESQSSDYMTVGATSDRIVLEAGDFLDVASFECFSFLWDTLGGFHFFADDEENFSHDFSAVAGETLSIKLMHSFCDLMFGEAYLYGAADYEVFYGKTYGVADGSFMTDEYGNVDIYIEEPGEYYIWCEGGIGSDDGTHDFCDHYNETMEPCIVSAPAYAKLTVAGETASGEIRQPQDVSAVLNATMTQLAATVTEPSFGTNAGEWTVFSLARGEYFAKDNIYFYDYYNRIIETVNETATNVNKNGALDKNKSTDNSRLIVALSAIGKDATSVGDWNLVDAYSKNGINWIKKQGINGTIWTLIALDSNDYQTEDVTIRQQCVSSILDAQHDDKGWSLVTNKAQASNVDITCMALTALYPYREQAEVAIACEEAIEWLSGVQLSTGGFPYGQGETSESCAWAIVALTTWGINPDTDSRFVKNGKSAVDNLLSYYIEDDAMFAHQGTQSNAMATDQACYALVAYNRFVNNKNSLFDYSDVIFDGKEEVVMGKPKATLALPSKITDDAGKTFNATVIVDQWDNSAGYKLIDLIINVPNGLSVIDVTADKRFAGGTVNYYLEKSTGKLRIVYFDPNENSDIYVSGNAFPVSMFNIIFCVDSINSGDTLDINIGGMSFKRTSDPNEEGAMNVVDISKATAKINVEKGISYNAVCLYVGDDVDLIPSNKKAVAVSVVGIDNAKKLIYNDGQYEYEFKYSSEISQKTGVITYVSLVDETIDMTKFVKKENYCLNEENANEILFGDSNGDGVVNAQDALSAVDMWLRKTEVSTEDEIIALNINADSRINTFDALGIVEKYVDGSEYIIIDKAIILSTITE